jgi:hypothetical protein
MKKVIRLTESDLTRIVRRVINEQVVDQAAMDQMVAKSNELLSGAVGLKFANQNGQLVSIDRATFGGGTNAGLAANFKIIDTQILFWFIPNTKNPKEIKISYRSGGAPVYPIDFNGVSEIFKLKGLNVNEENSKQSIQKLVPILQNAANVYTTQSIKTV